MPNLAETAHFVNALAPKDITGAATNTDVFSMKGHSHATLIVQLGVTGAASTITVEACDDFTPSNVAAIAYAAYKEETADGDTLGARTAIAAAGFATSTNNGIFYVIEVDAADLPVGKPNLRLVLSDPSAATFASVLAILTGPRYGGDQSATVIV